MTTPTVSVVVPTYRRAGVIRACLESVLTQSERDLEVIVVDDHSEDDTESVVMGCDDPRVRFVAHDTNRGGNAARSTGLELARGRYVAFLDSDDRWLPRKLERQLEGLADHPGHGLGYTWFDSVTPTGEITPDFRTRVEGLRCPELLIRNVVGTFSTVLVDREILTEIGGPDPTLQSCQDWDLFVRLNRVTAMTVVPEVHVHYLRDPDDPVRISTRRPAVVQGLRTVFERTAAHLDDLDLQQRTARGLSFMERLANAGATRDVLAVSRAVPARAWADPRVSSKAARLLARSERRRRAGGGRIRQ